MRHLSEAQSLHKRYWCFAWERAGWVDNKESWACVQLYETETTLGGCIGTLGKRSSIQVIAHWVSSKPDTSCSKTEASNLRAIKIHIQEQSALSTDLGLQQTNKNRRTQNTCEDGLIWTQTITEHKHKIHSVDCSAHLLKPGWPTVTGPPRLQWKARQHHPLGIGVVRRRS